MNCINCKKNIEAGEFVVLNGGALIKTKTGAMMGDKNLLGFLSVHNHFDSKHNYQSFYFANNEKNGQFEFYACSHQCLVDFITKNIMRFKKLETLIKPKIKITCSCCKREAKFFIEEGNFCPWCYNKYKKSARIKRNLQRSKSRKK